MEKTKYYCKKCRREIRKNHREETIEITGVKRELMDLDNKIDKERGYPKKAYKKKRENLGKSYNPREEKNKEYIPPAYRKEKGYIPEIKGSTFAKQKEKSNAYLSFEEKKNLLKMLMSRGLNFEEAKERVKQLIISQRLIREEYKSKINKINF